MSIERRRVLTPAAHPFEALSSPSPQKDEERRTTRDEGAARPEPEAATPKPTTKTTKTSTGSAPLVQMNARVPKSLRDEARTAAAQLTILTGERISQDEIVRRGTTLYLEQLYREHNNGRPFGRTVHHEV